MHRISPTDDGAAGPVLDIAVRDVRHHARGCNKGKILDYHEKNILRLLFTDHGFTVTSRHWVAPATISLANCAVARPRERHPLLASKQGQIFFHELFKYFPEILHLKVTTACSVVLLPSNHPFGKIPGDPQLISVKTITTINNQLGVDPD